MSRTVLAAVWVCVSFASPIRATPAQVIIIRHAEKPPEGKGLSQKGWQRAAALIPYFLERPEVLEFKTPVAIYAQKSIKGNHSSLRPVETVTPLAKALRLRLHEYAHDDYARMVRAILADRAYDGKMVLICWEHKGIPPLAQAFGVKNPPKWHGSDFDRTWVITLKSESAFLQNLPQKLLPGDSSK